MNKVLAFLLSFSFASSAYSMGIDIQFYEDAISKIRGHQFSAILEMEKVDRISGVASESRVQNISENFFEPKKLHVTFESFSEPVDFATHFIRYHGIMSIGKQEIILEELDFNHNTPSATIVVSYGSIINDFLAGFQKFPL